ncbi:unnamed protein product [Allacma fusca]|uniref:DOMON domain-containing protein n=1 Tax=Allacma fusca TaxID=39272 RepID=A0A8J2L6U8_9HEXA|nr:unnamed protein product [Allacma fusca]
MNYRILLTDIQRQATQRRILQLQTGKPTSYLVIGGVNGENLTPYFADRFGTTRQQGGSYYRYIDADASQDYVLISAREENGITRLRFIRDFDTGDTFDYVIKYENAYFIWAIGASDSLSQHSTSDRGAFSVNPLVARSDS